VVNARTRSRVALLVVVSAAWATLARAEPSAADQAAAETLFGDARKLMADGKFSEACPKLEESQRLDPAPGTEFNLGDCYEHVGKTASAWAHFLNVAAAAKSANMADREKGARERASAVEARLVRLSVQADGPPPDLVITRDGAAIGRPQWGVPVPVDPGPHRITASAPGKKTWESTVEVGAELVAVVVPPLADLGQQTAPTGGSPSDEPHPGRTQRVLAVAVVGLGVAGLAVGTVFGLKDKSKLDDASAHCTGNRCDATGVTLRDQAIKAGNVSTILFTAGLVALAGGAVLWFTAPSSLAPRSTLAVTPVLAASGAGAALAGSW
jgi:hypothetical protein